MEGPTVLAFFATSPGEIERDPEAAEALADFQYYLPSMAREFAQRGIEFQESYRETIAVLNGDAADLFVPRVPPAAVAYVL